VPVDGKGLGVLAARPLQRGERLLAELPLATLTRRGGRLDQHAFEDVVGTLSPSARAAYFALSQSEVLYGSRKSAEGVWRSNAYPTGTLADGAPQAAVFSLACRLNHSCSPNAHVAWSTNLQRQTVHALRPIKEGDEVLVSYLEPGLARCERRDAIRRKFGFDCACSLCTLHGAELEESDARQRRISQIDSITESCSEANNGRGYHPQMLSLVGEKLALFKAEGLPAEWAHMDMVSAFTRCCNDSDYCAARRWMRRAVKAANTMLGSDSALVHQLKQIL